MANLDVDMAPLTPVEFIEAGPEIEQFANALDDCLSPMLADSDKRERLLNLPRRYHDNASKRLAKLRPTRARNSHDDVDMDADEMDGAGLSLADSETVKQLVKEAQTWDLLGRVLPLRHPNVDGTSRRSRLDMVADRPTHDSSLHTFFQTNSVAKERRAVLQWLQTNAASGPDIDDLTRELQQSADRGDIIAHGWLHTRSSIKLKKSVTGWPHLLDQQSGNVFATHTTDSGTPLVTQLDPDAPTRQDRKLRPQDEYFERAIWRGCFEHLRRGSSLQTIRDWCQERTEMWRAISMSGMLLSREGDDVADGAGPASLALWRRMCFGLARQGGSDDYERGVYGVLSGDILSVEKVARTWDDYLFAHYNALLRTQLDTFILGRCPPEEASNLTQTFPSFDAVQFHGEDAGVEKRLIRSLEAKAGIRDEAFEPNKALQASIISHEIDEYLYNQGRAMAPTAESTAVGDIQARKYFTPEQHNGLRIVAHVYVMMKLLEELDSRRLDFAEALRSRERQDAEDNILAQYAAFLRRAGLPELIPMYCSILKGPRRYEVLSSNLILEESHERRLNLLSLMKQAGIDGREFAKFQAKLVYDKVARPNAGAFEAKTMFRILEEGPPTARMGRVIKADFFGEDPEDVEPGHEYLIRCVEWLLMVTETWPEALSFGTKVYKFFLRHMYLRPALRLAQRVPFANVMRDIGADEDFDESYDNVGVWAELLEQSGIEGTAPEQVLEDARNFRDLEALVRALDNLETMGSSAQVVKDAPPGERGYWTPIGEAARITQESMEPLLKGWLIPGIQAGDEELREIRQAYLPETVLAYISALHFAGTGLSRDWLLECMNLATLVSETKSDLEETFVEAKRVRELLEALAASSKALAIATGDKRAAGTSSKKLREKGWSRDLWSVKP